jgi:hypothetical protein
MKEAAHHRRAFEAYYAMGEKRTLPAVAKKLNVSHASVKLWSRSFGWGTRVAERDDSVADLVERKATKTEVDRHTRNRQIVQAGIIATARAIAEGRITPTLADLDRLVRLEGFLAGEADSRQEVIERELAGKTTAELKAMLKAELRGLAAYIGDDAEFEVLGEGDAN